MTLTLAIAVALTSAISGVLGMAGGLILMGIYAWALPIPAAMALHGATQLASNGFRALLLLPHVRSRVLLPYVGGVLAALGPFLLGRIVVPRGLLFLVLGRSRSSRRS